MARAGNVDPPALCFLRVRDGGRGAPHLASRWVGTLTTVRLRCGVMLLFHGHRHLKWTMQCRFIFSPCSAVSMPPFGTSLNIRFAGSPHARARE